MSDTPSKSNPDQTPDKSREGVLAGRQAKKLAKQAKKNKTEQRPAADSMPVPKTTESKPPANDIPKVDENMSPNKPEATPKAQAPPQRIPGGNSSADPEATASNTAQGTEDKKKTLSKAERRAIQEAQRAAKAAAAPSAPKSAVSKANVSKSAQPAKSALSDESKQAPEQKQSPKSAQSTQPNNCKVRLFNHIESARIDMSLFVNNPQIHPCIARLGEQYAQRTIIGSNARCIAFLSALKTLTQDFETPPKKEFSRSIEALIKTSVEYLQKCRPLSVSVVNAYKYVKQVLTQLSTDSTESNLKEDLCRFIDTYLENQIGKAAQAISDSMQEKISNGDVILTFGCSSLIHFICEEAHKRKVDFRVIVVDSRPFCEGQELLRRLSANGISCSYVLINAVSFVMPEATKVLLGAHALLSNGYVMARTGTAQVALVAHSFNVPVLVCCETHKFSERFQTDAIVFNELGNPNDLILNDKCCLTNWQAKPQMTPLNLLYDITPPQLVTAVVTEVSILPCTSVPVILRIKPTEISYYS